MALAGCMVKRWRRKNCGAALVIAGLAAEGETVIRGSEHIERGYQDICRDLGQLGAEICCITDHTEQRWEDN